MKTLRTVCGLLAAAIMCIGVPALTAAAPAATAPRTTPLGAPHTAPLGAAPGAIRATDVPVAGSCNVSPGPYVSPWGTAQVTWGPAFKALLDAGTISLATIAPVQALGGNAGVVSDIGSTTGDSVDVVNFGRVCYPGGWVLSNPATGGSWSIDRFWLRFSPSQGLSGYPTVNGVPSRDEQLFCTYTLADAAFGGGGWSFDAKNVGVKTTKVPLSLTRQGAEGFNRALGTSFKEGDSLGVLSGTFRYLP